ncbi:translation initiation factor 3 complex subunit L [Pelagophyceae sp. CCMP2097]|nr:translation initiation factor 3 complex subunit L [Pelagophyceae sp. CCMP2097]
MLAEDIERLYSVEWKELSEKYCDKQPWPTREAISSQCIGDDGRPDDFFLRLYEEMALRHLFAKLKPTLQDRIDAWRVYLDLFAQFEKCQELSIALSPQWVFDILHEFVYQFQSFCQFRTQNAGRTPQDRALLQQNQSVWSANVVLEHLRILTDVSKIATAVKAPSETHAQFGYFAIVTQSRLECLLGDYESAVELLMVPCVKPFDEASLCSKVFACRITCLYHLGFALLMLKRYRESISVFNSMLAYLARLQKSGGFARFSAADQVQKNHDRMLALLAVAVALAPGAAVVDDVVVQNLKDKYGDKMALCARGDVPAFHALLTFACPKFVVPAVPDYDSNVDSTNDAYRLQVDLFIAQVAHQQRLAKIRSYLKLYTSIGIDKLARFNDVSPQEFRTHLVGIKQKLRAQSGGEALAPFYAPVSANGDGAGDLHFYVAGDMLHVDEPPCEVRHDDFFAGQMQKYDGVIATLHQQRKK